MACLTCNHSIQRLDVRDGVPVYWCPRCGTILDGKGKEQPRLVSNIIQWVKSQSMNGTHRSCDCSICRNLLESVGELKG